MWKRLIFLILLVSIPANCQGADYNYEYSVIAKHNGDSLSTLSRRWDGISSLPVWNRTWERIIPIVSDILGSEDDSVLRIGVEKSEKAGSDTWVVRLFEEAHYDMFISGETLRCFQNFTGGEKVYPPTQNWIKFNSENVQRAGVEGEVVVLSLPKVNLRLLMGLWNTQEYLVQNVEGVGTLSDSSQRMLVDVTTISSRENVFRDQDFSGSGGALGLKLRGQVYSNYLVEVTLQNIIAREKLDTLYVEELRIDTQNFHVDEQGRLQYASSGSGKWEYRDLTVGRPLEWQASLTRKGSFGLGCLTLDREGFSLSLAKELGNLTVGARWVSKSPHLEIHVGSPKWMVQLATDSWRVHDGRVLGLTLGYIHLF